MKFRLNFCITVVLFFKADPHVIRDLKLQFCLQFPFGVAVGEDYKYDKILSDLGNTRSFRRKQNYYKKRQLSSSERGSV